jgi:hypothetical protein
MKQKVQVEELTGSFLRFLLTKLTWATNRQLLYHHWMKMSKIHITGTLDELPPHPFATGIQWFLPKYSISNPPDLYSDHYVSIPSSLSIPLFVINFTGDVML